MVVELYESLEYYTSRIRDAYEVYEERAIQICGESQQWRSYDLVLGGGIFN